jgi:TROVE domain
MAKFAKTKKAPNVTSPVTTTSGVPDATTYEGGAGFSRDPKSELFLLAVVNMVGEQTFYEGARERDRRFAALVHQVTQDDPAWIARFVPFLRDTMQLRSASVVMAAEFARARAERSDAEAEDSKGVSKGGSKAGPTTRSVVSAALSRADEPAEMLAYWHQAHGRRIPQPVKRGIADATRRLYTERAALKYDGASNAYRMADVLDLAHPEPTDAKQSALFKLLLDRRHERERIDVDAELLPVVAARAELEAMPLDDRRALLEAPDVSDRFNAAGVTWEWLSGWLNGPMDARAWEAVIPSMGYMALLRNLRNFDDAGIAGATRDQILAKLTDPEEVARSRQLPLRFYAAYANTKTLHWAPALEYALELSLANVPALAGRTLVMVDVSGSMASPMSNRSRAQRWELAALFGAALAARAENADVVAFQSFSQGVDVAKGGSVLRAIEQFKPLVGGGTETFPALQQHYKDHDRVVILTDEQAFAQWNPVFSPAPARKRGLFGLLASERPAPPTPAQDIDAPIYTFNLAGYRVGHLPSGELRRHTFGGLTDRAFAAIALLERGLDADWSTLFDSKPETSAGEDDADEEARP